MFPVFDRPLGETTIPRTHRYPTNSAFAVAAPSSWNSLPDNFSDSQSYSIFKNPNLGLKLTISTSHFIAISYLLVVLFNLYFLCTAPLSYGWGGITNPDDMMIGL